MKRCKYCELKFGRHNCVVANRIVDPDRPPDFVDRHSGAITGAAIGTLIDGLSGGIIGGLLGSLADDDDD